MKNNSSAPKSKGIEESQILVVDDDPIIRMLHQRIVKSAAPGFSVYACKNGEEAVNRIIAARARNIRFLVLLDINMPVMNGWEFLQHCQKKKFENILVMMVSSSVNTSDRKRAVTFPQVFRYCEKPLKKNQLADIILQIKRRVFSASSCKGSDDVG